MQVLHDIEIELIALLRELEPEELSALTARFSQTPSCADTQVRAPAVL